MKQYLTRLSKRLQSQPQRFQGLLGKLLLFSLLLYTVDILFDLSINWEKVLGLSIIFLLGIFIFSPYLKIVKQDIQQEKQRPKKTISKSRSIKGLMGQQMVMDSAPFSHLSGPLKNNILIGEKNTIFIVSDKNIDLLTAPEEQSKRQQLFRNVFMLRKQGYHVKFIHPLKETALNNPRFREDTEEYNSIFQAFNLPIQLFHRN